MLLFVFLDRIIHKHFHLLLRRHRIQRRDLHTVHTFPLPVVSNYLFTQIDDDMAVTGGHCTTEMITQPTVVNTQCYGKMVGLEGMPSEPRREFLTPVDQVSTDHLFTPG